MAVPWRQCYGLFWYCHVLLLCWLLQNTRNVLKNNCRKLKQKRHYGVQKLSFNCVCNDDDKDTSVSCFYCCWRLLGCWQDVTARCRESRHSIHSDSRRRSAAAATSRGQLDRVQRQHGRTRRWGNGHHASCDAGRRTGRYHGRRRRLRLCSCCGTTSSWRGWQHHRHQVPPRHWQ